MSTKPVEPLFEESLKTLEGIVLRMEQGEIDLQDALQQFEQGMQLIQRCQATLNQAEQQINQLTDVNQAVKT